MKSTKKSLLMSVLSLVLCFAMLLGTTYAWFTDSVTSGTNRIVAGNLDVDMLYKSGTMTEYATVKDVGNNSDGTTPFFVNKDGGKVLWEPGAMVYTYFDVKNLGTLAFQYNFALRITGMNALETAGYKHTLSEVVKAVVLDDEVAGDEIKTAVADKTWNSIESFEDKGSMLPNGDKKFTVVLYWEPTDHDNLYNVNNGQHTSDVGAWSNEDNNALYIDFDIRLTATQVPHESDSFDKFYDNIELGLIPAAWSGESVAAEYNNGGTYEVVVGGETKASVEVPEGAKTEDGAALSASDQLKLVVTPGADAVIKVETGNSMTTYDVSLVRVSDNKKVTSDNPMKVTLDVGFVDLIRFYHKGVQYENRKATESQVTSVGDFFYNETTGIVTFMTKDFSPFSAVYKFAGGIGTENYPYLLANATHFQNVVSGTSSAKKYYQLINDIDLSATGTAKDSGIVSLFEYAVLNGANHQIAVNNSEYYLFYTVLYSTISDVNVVELKYPMVKEANFSTFNDVDTIGKINCANQNMGIYVRYAKPTKDEAESTHAELTYIDCDCGVDFSSAGGKYNGVFTGYAYPSYPTELTYTNCTYNATFVSGKAAMFLGNNSANSGHVTINVNNCENRGSIRSTDANYNWSSYVATGISSNASDPSFTNNTVKLNGVQLTADNICEPMGYGFVQGPNDANLKLVQNSDGTFTVTASEGTNVSYYVVSVGLYSAWNAGGSLVQQVREKIETSAFNNKTFTTALKNLSFVDKAWVEANSSATAETVGEGEYAYTVYTLNGIQYYYLPNVEEANVGGQPKAPQMIVVSCYDANGGLFASAVLSK